MSGRLRRVGAERIAVRYSKWGGIDHWHFELEPLGQDQFGWWFFGRKGITQQRGAEPPIVLSHDFVLLMPAAGCWTACFNAENELEIYVDVTTRPALDDAAVSAVNLDLDVVRWRTAGWRSSTRTSSPSTRCNWATRPS